MGLFFDVCIAWTWLEEGEANRERWMASDERQGGRGGWAATSSYWSLQLRHSRETALGSNHVTPTTGCARHRTIMRLFSAPVGKGGRRGVRYGMLV